MNIQNKNLDFGLGMLILLALAALAQSQDIDFSSASGITDAIENGLISFDEAVVSDFTTNSIRSQLLSERFSANIEVEGKINTIGNGVISTSKVNSFDLSNYKNFAGKIMINLDGSISVINTNTNKGTDVSIGSKKIILSGGSEIKVEGIESFSLMPGSKVIYKGTTVENLGADGLNVLFSSDGLPVNSGNLVLFSDSAREITIDGDNIKITLSKDSEHDKINLEGDNIEIINGRMAFIKVNGRFEQKTPISETAKSMVINDKQNGDVYFIASPAIKTEKIVMGFKPDPAKLDRFAPRGDSRAYFSSGNTELPDGKMIQATRTELATQWDTDVVIAIQEEYDKFLKSVESENLPDSRKQEWVKTLKYLKSQISPTIVGNDGISRGVGYTTTFVTSSGLILIIPAKGDVLNPERKLLIEGQKTFTIPPDLAKFIIKKSTEDMIKIKREKK